MCLVSYSSFDDALVNIWEVGDSALLAKLDIKSAFHLLPIHPSAFNSLGFVLQGEYFFDKGLPTGCSLSCSYFELFSTFLEWVLCYRSGSFSCLHYLDDFLFVGRPDSLDCPYLFTEFRSFSDNLQIIWGFFWRLKNLCL